MRKYKRIAKYILMSVTGLLPFKLLRKWAGRNPVIINYHSIQDWDPDQTIARNTYRTVKRLEEDLQFFKERFSLIDISVLIDKKSLPDNSLLITIDDGLKSVFDLIYPVFKKCDAVATFFINPCFVDNKDLHYLRKRNLILEFIQSSKKYLDKELRSSLGKNDITIDQLVSQLKKIKYSERELLNELADVLNIRMDKILQDKPVYLSTTEIELMIKDGFSVGAHSMDHPPFNELSIEEQASQVVESVKWIENRFHQSNKLFAFPSNDAQITSILFSLIQDKVDLTFGVQGLKTDEINQHYHRIEVESTGLSARCVLKYEYVGYLINKMLGRSVYKRS